MPINQEQLVKAAQDINGTLMERAYVPMFVKLAAAKGVQINDEADLQAALNIVSRIEQEEASQPSLLKQASARLSPATADTGIVKAAAADAGVRNAILAQLQLQQLVA